MNFLGCSRWPPVPRFFVWKFSKSAEKGFRTRLPGYVIRLLCSGSGNVSYFYGSGSGSGSILCNAKVEVTSNMSLHFSYKLTERRHGSEYDTVEAPFKYIHFFLRVLLWRQ
jgi:hypothetical protein